MKLKWTAASLVTAGGGLPVLASGGAEALIQPEVGTIFWTALTFLIMAFLLGKFAWKPLLGAVDARAKSIQETLDQAAKDRADAEGLLKQQQDLVNEARRERAEALAQGQKDAEKVKADMIGEARRQRDQLLEQTQDQIAASLQQAQSELRKVTADLAIEAAEKLLGKNLDDPTQRKLVEDYLADLERSGGNSPTPPS